MATLEQIQAGIEFIERHLEDEFSLADVAAAGGMSQWHFQRVFKALTRETLKSYIRSRRLAGALHALLETDRRIIEVAMAAGFESQEAFTRAFRQAFDMTPAHYRRVGQRNQFLKKVQLTPAYLEALGQQSRATPDIRKMGPLLLVGLRTDYFGEGSEKNNVAEKLPGLWADFLRRMDEVPALVPGVGYGVIEQTLHEDRLSYTAAAQSTMRSLTDPTSRGTGSHGAASHGAASRGLAPDASFRAARSGVSVDMCVREVPLAEYAIFEHRGPVRALDHTVSYAYSTWLLTSGRRHSGGPDLEIYGEGYHPTSPGSVIHYAMPLA